jgi:hypothetical protein
MHEIEGCVQDFRNLVKSLILCSILNIIVNGLALFKRVGEECPGYIHPPHPRI